MILSSDKIREPPAACRRLPFYRSGSGRFHMEPQPIRDHCDEFAVGRLAARVVDRVAEIGVEHVDVADPHEY